MLNIEVVFADAAGDQRQVNIPLQVEDGCTVRTAIEQSNILVQFPHINLMTTNKVGIFGKVVALDTILQMGDRIEIYRPLLIDPKQARQARARRQKVVRGIFKK
jgi:putative ubiquitin-RnfH superfamily antitoxin RatB of RatAB toxin-antitoxin module